MIGEVGLAGHTGEKLRVGADDKGGPLARDGTHSFDAECLGDALVGIGQQRVPEGVGGIEFLLPTHRVGADTYAMGIEFSELASQIAEVAAFLRSTRGHCLWVEEQHHRTRFEQV